MQASPDPWSDALHIVSEAFEMAPRTVLADTDALGSTALSLEGLIARRGGRPVGWDRDYVQHYLWVLLDGMPSLELAGRPSRS